MNIVGGGDSYNDGKDKDTGDNKEFGQKEKEEEKVPADEGKAGKWITLHNSPECKLRPVLYY